MIASEHHAKNKCNFLCKTERPQLHACRSAFPQKLVNVAQHHHASYIDYEAAKSCSQSNMRGTSLTQPELLEGLRINIKIQQNQQALDIPRP